MDLIKVFIGCSPNGEDAESLAVLEHTLTKNTTGPIVIEYMKLSRNPDNTWYSNPPDGWNTTKWATPFSGFRWGIPGACGYHGRALYMDSDMIVLKDLRELWELDLEGKVAAMKEYGRSDVTLWDCEKYGEMMQTGHMPHVPSLRHDPGLHSSMQNYFAMYGPSLVKLFDRKWNNFDGENDAIEDIGILHYTDMSTQMHSKAAAERLAKDGRKHWFDGQVRPHRRPDIQALFDKLLQEAIETGFGPEAFDPPPSERYGDYKKQSQANYKSNNGFDVTKGQ